MEHISTTAKKPKKFIVLPLFFYRFSPYEWDNPHPCTEEPEVSYIEIYSKYNNNV